MVSNTDNTKNKKFTTKLQNDLDKLNAIPESAKQSKETLYKYSKDCISFEAQKKFRSKIRRSLDNYLMDVLRVHKNENCTPEERTKSVTDFKTFYEANFIRNDFNLNSVTNSKNENAANYYKVALEICKEYNSK